MHGYLFSRRNRRRRSRRADLEQSGRRRLDVGRPRPNVRTWHQTETRSRISRRSGVEGRPEVAGAVQNNEMTRLESPETVATVTSLAPVLPLMTESDSELWGPLPQ
jgi:hypothetical protein